MSASGVATSTARRARENGGARIIYYYMASDSHIYLVFAYAKNRQADLTKTQLAELAAFVATQVP